jgi:phosphopantothenate synthetase
MFILYILLATLALIGLLAFVGDRVAAVDGKQAALIIQKFDEKYEEFVNAKLSFWILKDQSIREKLPQLREEIMKILKPDIDALIHHVNSSIYTGVKIPYISKYFRNIVSMAESFYRIKQKNANKLLSEEDIKKFLQSCREAIEADLRTRVLNLDLGNVAFR